MRLTTFADLGLRSMMILGDLPEGERLTIADLAKATNASDNHLARVIAKLVEMKLVVSVRGRNGGAYLSDTARGASVGKILRQIEGSSEVVDCAGTRPCPLAARDCALRHRLADAQEAFFATLDDDTIGDLIATTRPVDMRTPEDAHGTSRALGVPNVPRRSS
ncbi:Rrf2 DNA-binding transcription regulator [Corynebacterium resistens DSM 45100]|uniref:Rrf2 DNA-binding transcription regulator n=1 Tax=Corynebacterium resistens (strain DSM 45100 / JCM 12819 / GTC 2026 / SICGH 158) TaxID=662755 RepID=F8E206_CORRG|nr:Rrf2 family transcriptional regulator [Corynebacterium resistens]AEI08560.1 Rrf2 DNA-binding transcription regulator [Corynebacterium resistens DSM 45100]